ncbi:MAG: hypothetical protein DRN26_01060 [Thermoplasmata archaeon]|nr:MAG: hypothetical protein DRN26_01060 [Thermoplasmata archaeon]
MEETEEVISENKQDDTKDKKGISKFKIKGMLVERPDGTIERTKMFDILEVPLDDYSDLEFTLDEIRRLRMHIMKMRTGIQAMAPLICAGPVKCVFRHRCPLVDRSIRTADGKHIDFHNQNLKKFPILRQCLVERDFLDFKRAQYIEEYDVDVNSPTEMGMVNKLAELDLYEYRATLVLAHGDDEGDGVDLLKTQITWGKNGQETKTLLVHPAFELKEKIHRMREGILRSMVGTRQEQYKRAAALKEKQAEDPSTMIAALKQKILEARQDQENIIDAEFTEEKKEE